MELPTDVDTADVHAVAATGATVTLQGTGTSVRSVEGAGTRHEWNAFQLYRGSAATVRNVYDVVVTEAGTSKTYRLTVTRKADIAPAFPDNGKITLEYYDNIDVSRSVEGAFGTAEGGKGQRQRRPDLHLREEIYSRSFGRV